MLNENPPKNILKMAIIVIKSAENHPKSTRIPRISGKYLRKEFLKNPRKKLGDSECSSWKGPHFIQKRPKKSCSLSSHR